MSHSQNYLSGLRAGVPVVLGYVPVAVAYAVMARQAGFSGLETISMSLFVFAGASQMIAAGMYAQGAGIVAIILATFILNLRHLIMSTCVINRMKKDSTAVKLASAVAVTDESFALFTTADEAHSSGWYYLGLITMTYSSWVLGTVLGVAVPDFLPPLLKASLAVSLYAMFLGILIPGLRGKLRLVLLVAATAACNSLLSLLLPSSWSLIVSTLLCAAVGSFFVAPDGGEVRE